MATTTLSQKLGTFFFALYLVLAIIIDFLGCFLLSIIFKLGLISRKTQGGLAVSFTKITWSCAVFSSFWIKSFRTETTAPGAWDEFIADMDATDAAVKQGAIRQPTFILSNHLGYFDTLVIVVYTPWKVLWRIRCYMGSFLFGIPLFATICKVIGHFPVYFLKSEDGKFSVDAKKMAKVETWVEEHLSNGGILSLFPEGAVNKKPDVLQTFRHGTFKKALEKDAKIWHFVLAGHDHVWPHGVPIAGYPCYTAMKLIPMCPKGARATVAMLRELPDVSKDTPDYQLLADHCRDVMQKQYDDLKTYIIDETNGKNKSN